MTVTQGAAAKVPAQVVKCLRCGEVVAVVMVAQAESFNFHHHKGSICPASYQELAERAP